MKARAKFGTRISAALRLRPMVGGGFALDGRYKVVCRDKDGKHKWTDYIENLVVDAGIAHMMDTEFSGGAAVDPWYLGLCDDSPTPAAADTMASHAGWVEFTEYDEAARVAWVEVRSGKVMTNSASPADFTISGAGGGLGGAFLTSIDTKGGTTGTLMSVGALTGGNRVVAASDTVALTFQLTGADDGA